MEKSDNRTDITYLIHICDPHERLEKIKPQEVLFNICHKISTHIKHLEKDDMRR